MAKKFFPETIFLLKVYHCERFSNQYKIDGMVKLIIIQAAVTRNDFLKRSFAICS